MIAFVLNGISH